MAEYVRRRYRTARFTTAVALLGVLTGIGLNRGDDSVFEYDDAAAKTITIRGNSITSKHIKNGSLLSKDFKSGELERKWENIVLKRGYVTEAMFPDQLVRHIDKATPLLAKTFDDAFVGEGEFGARFDKHIEKWRPSFDQSISAAFVGEGELDAQLDALWQKTGTASKKHLDLTYVRDDELSASMAAVFEKQSGATEALDRLYVKFFRPSQALAMPPLGTASSAFDVATIEKSSAGEPPICPSILEVTGFLTVCAAANQQDDGFTVRVANTFDTTLFMTYSPAGVQAGGGKEIPANTSVTIPTPNQTLRTIQVAPLAGDDVPMATLTVSGHRASVDAPLRISTNLTVARPQ